MELGDLFHAVASAGQELGQNDFRCSSKTMKIVLP